MNRLSLAVQPGYYLSSMRRELPLSDFYAEITARPSLCRGDDNYGVIARGVGSSFYRFVLTCNGEIRAERISGGTRLPIYDPVPSGDVARPPQEVRIGIWAVGEEMRLFLNDRYQFSVQGSQVPHRRVRGLRALERAGAGQRDLFGFRSVRCELHPADQNALADPVV